MGSLIAKLLPETVMLQIPRVATEWNDKGEPIKFGSEINEVALKAQIEKFGNNGAVLCLSSDIESDAVYSWMNTNMKGYTLEQYRQKDQKAMQGVEKISYLAFQRKSKPVEKRAA